MFCNYTHYLLPILCATVFMLLYAINTKETATIFALNPQFMFLFLFLKEQNKTDNNDQNELLKTFAAFHLIMQIIPLIHRMSHFP